MQIRDGLAAGGLLQDEQKDILKQSFSLGSKMRFFQEPTAKKPFFLKSHLKAYFLHLEEAARLKPVDTK